MERQLIVVELFPMWPAVPRSFSGVLKRMVQLQCTNRLTCPDQLAGTAVHAAVPR